MITSALISELRREYSDEPKTTQMSRQGNGSVNLFNLVKFPIIEGSYKIYVSGIVKTETTDFTLDLDNGDLFTVATPGNGIEVKSQHKYAYWRDKNWNDAINSAIETLNARGFFRQIVRNTSLFKISANTYVYSAPSACVDLYELLIKSGQDYVKPVVNWEYQQDGNKVVLGSRPTSPASAAISYLRNLQTYQSTSATLDILNDWRELVKKKAGANYYRSLAGKVAKQGNATIDEGHFSFTNLRTQANDLEAEFERLVARKKPTRPAKDLQYHL
jgi:hypothetical protein